MSEFFDIYIIKNTRNKNEVNSFNQHFLVDYEEMACEYEIPKYSSSPCRVLHNSKEILSYCEFNTKTDYAVYWTSKKNHLRSEVFYTCDGHTIFGLSTENEADCNFLFKEMSDFLGCDFGYITVETPAPFSLDCFSSNFIAEARKKKKYRKYIPNDKFDLQSIKNVSINEIEDDKTLCYALLCWCQDYNWPVAKEIIKLMETASDKINPCIYTILDFNDDDWKISLETILKKHGLKEIREIVLRTQGRN